MQVEGEPAHILSAPTAPTFKGSRHVLATYPDALATTMIGAADPPIRVAHFKFPRGSCTQYKAFGRCRYPGALINTQQPIVL
jgi:hypothetical protein